MTNTPMNQVKYKNKMIAEGNTRVTVWVPKKDKPELMSIVKEMRDEYETARRKKG